MACLIICDIDMSEIMIVFTSMSIFVKVDGFGAHLHKAHPMSPALLKMQLTTTSGHPHVFYQTPFRPY